MWSGGDDYNEDGETVRLYQPILYGSKPSQDDVTECYAGGHPAAAAIPPIMMVPTCALCHKATHLLIQLHVPRKDGGRTYCVFACNQASCFNQMFTESALFSFAGAGVVHCLRVSVDQTQTNRLPTSNPSPPKPTTSAAAWMDDQSGNDAEWNDGWDDSQGHTMIDLESKLAAMEASAPSRTAKATKLTKANQPKVRKIGFPCYELHALQEPPARRLDVMDDDEDNIGVMSAGITDEKIRQMLARYMAEEEDEGILAALRGSAEVSSVGGSSCGGIEERDERLSADDRALMTYTDRLKRSARQVLRYAYNGEPIWSIPPPLQEVQFSKFRSKKPRAKQQPIPPCSCGSPRVFEFQLLPSLLHVLQVDQFHCRGNINAAFMEGGMNWGNIAVYTCSDMGCSASDEEYVVVQESAEGKPSQQARQYAAEPVVIAEGTDFTNQDDDDNNAEDDDDDDDSLIEDMDENSEE